jgi:hypothetical protein
MLVITWNWNLLKEWHLNVFCLFQSQDAILDGTHPVTLEEAISLAGIQSHIQFGDYNENKHKSGFLEWVISPAFS